MNKGGCVTTLICTMQASPSAPPESAPEGESISLGGSGTGRASQDCKGDEEILTPRSLAKCGEPGEFSQQHSWGLCGQVGVPGQPVSLSPVPSCFRVPQNREPLALCTGEPTQGRNIRVTGSQNYVPLVGGISAHHNTLKPHPQSRTEPRCSTASTKPNPRA